MPWWEYASSVVTLNYELGNYIYHRWISDQPRAERPTDDRLPRVDEGSALPLVYGRCRLRTPALVWFGNYLATGDSYTRGPLSPATTDHYSIDMLFALGVPFYGGKATFEAMWVGDSSLDMAIETSFGTTIGFGGGAGAHTPADSTKLSVNGVFYQGTAFQDVTNGTPVSIFFPSSFLDGVSYGTGTSYLDALRQNGSDESVIPGYKNQLMMWVHFAFGLTPVIPVFSLEVTALSTGTPSDLGQSLVTDADPAAVIFDLLTSPWGKLHIPASRIYRPSFEAASITLYNEGHGYSRAIDRAEDATSIIGNVLRQIDGIIFVEPTTGQLWLKLIRNDFDPNNLVDINPDNAEPAGSSWYQIQGWAETMNAVRLTFTDRAMSYGDGLALGQNQANIRGQGGRLRPVELNFVGCCTPELAGTLASRELGVVSRPVVKATVVVNRSLYQLRPGDVTTFTWPPLGIDHMIMRIADVNRGTLRDGKITLRLIRDVFDQTAGAFPPPS